MRRPSLAVGLAALLMGGGVVAKPAPAQAPGDRTPTRQVAVDVQVDRFAVVGRDIVARGSSTSRVRTRDGMVRTQRKAVRLAVSAGQSCRVLYLRLDDLQVKLLGLNVDTSTVTVRIAGDDRRVLGRLFCQLAKSIKLERVTDAAGVTRSLNRRLRGRPMEVLGFRAALNQQQAPAPAPGQPPMCPILDLTIGPLNLDLLGLVVDLYGATRSQPVRVVATADPNGGVLGATLCKLSQGQAVL